MSEPTRTDSATKKCIRCGETKPLNQYNRRNSCIDCERSRKREVERIRRETKNVEVKAIRRRSHRRVAGVASSVASVAGPWTPAEDSVLLEEGMTKTKAAARLGRSLGSVEGRWRYLKERQREEVLIRARRWTAQKASETLPTARNRRKEWTGPELELASRTDLTAVQVALMIGRTASAVETQRSNMRRDPRRARLAGQPGGEAAAP